MVRELIQVTLEVRKVIPFHVHLHLLDKVLSLELACCLLYNIGLLDLDSASLKGGFDLVDKWVDLRKESFPVNWLLFGSLHNSLNNWDSLTNTDKALSDITC